MAFHSLYRSSLNWMAFSSRGLQTRAQAASSSSSLPQPSSQRLCSRLVFVASKNPAKVNAVQRALVSCFPGIELTITGREAPSGVPNQPYGDQETLAGAQNRVASLLSALAASSGETLQPTSPLSAATADAAAVSLRPTAWGPSAAVCDLLVAIEGGVGPATAPGQAGALECFAWVCVRDLYTGAESTARSASFALPAPLSNLLLHEGIELGDADEALFGRAPSKEGSGTIGKLSNGVLDRTDFYVQATVCALLPYMQPHMYGAQYGGFMERGMAACDLVAG